MIYIPSKILKLLQSDSLKLEQNEELIELLPKTFNTVKLKPNTKCHSYEKIETILCKSKTRADQRKSATDLSF